MNTKDLKKFIIKLLFFISPLLLGLSFVVYVLLATGELLSPDVMIKKQMNSNDDILVGLAYSNPFKYFKLNSVLKRNPEIIALGSSRVMQFRSEFFNSDKKFYNAGGSVSSLSNLLSFLKNIPSGKEPKIIILGLDQWFFYSKGDEGEFLKFNTKTAILRNNFKNVYKNYFIDRKFSLSDIYNKKDIGLNALVNQEGFRSDGSYRYGSYRDDTREEKMANELEHIRNGNGKLGRNQGEEISLATVEQLKQFLIESKSRGIYVVGFLPPFANIINDTMTSMSDKYKYMRELPVILEPLFAEQSLKFYDFSDMSSVASDKEFIDVMHGSEKMYLRLYLTMLKNDDILKQYSDIKYLQQALLDTDNNYIVFGD